MSLQALSSKFEASNHPHSPTLLPPPQLFSVSCVFSLCQMFFISSRFQGRFDAAAAVIVVVTQLFVVAVVACCCDVVVHCTGSECGISTKRSRS